MSPPTVELSPGAEDSPFATMMAELIRTNLADHPRKQRDLAAMSGRVALIAEDADSACTLLFRRGTLSVQRGMLGIPDLIVRGTAEALIDLSRIPPDPRLRFLPDLRSEVARSLGRALVTRRLRVGGLLTHTLLALRLARVLSIY